MDVFIFYCIFQANTEDPDQTSCSAASELGLQTALSLHMSLKRVSGSKKRLKYPKVLKYWDT